MRADQLLIHLGLAASRTQAQRLIAAGVEWRINDSSWQRIHKNSETLPLAAELRILDNSEQRYVSRGGLKLAGALAATDLNAEGAYCLDVGQSTGGFSDCLLQAGAQHIVGIDVGHGQLHPSLGQHPRIQAFEGIHARELSHAQLQKLGVWHDWPTQRPQAFDLVVADLSFISLTLILPALPPLLAENGHLLLLVKPQFELQAADLGKNGLVKNPAKYQQVEDKLRRCCAEWGLEVLHWLDSPITGGTGNHEFFLHAQCANRK